MVYFKLNKELQQLISESEFEGLCGCEKYCDRQIISYADLDKAVQKLKNKFNIIKAKIEKKQVAEQKKKEMSEQRLE